MQLLKAVWKKLWSLLKQLWESKTPGPNDGPRENKEGNLRSLRPSRKLEARVWGARPGVESGPNGGGSDAGISASVRRQDFGIRKRVFDAELERGEIRTERDAGDEISLLIEKRPSPNYSKRTSSVKCVIIHYTAGGPASGALKWFSMPESKVSAHYVISRDGEVYEVVDPENRAWHAGRAKSPFGEDVNNHSIGIELCNWGLLDRRDGEYWTTTRKPILFPGKTVSMVSGQYWERYPEEQLKALEFLLTHLAQSGYGKACKHLLGHNEVAPGRKIDPGDHFPWERFRAAV